MPVLSDDLETLRGRLAEIMADLRNLSCKQDDTTMRDLLRNAAGSAWATAIAVHEIKRHALRAEASNK